MSILADSRRAYRVVAKDRPERVLWVYEWNRSRRIFCRGCGAILAEFTRKGSDKSRWCLTCRPVEMADAP